MAGLLSRVCNVYLPRNWSLLASGDDEKRIEVAKNSHEYITVCQPITNAFMSSIYCRDRIQRVVRIQNPYLWGCYLLKKEEYARRCISYRELTLYHHTHPSYAESIAKENFNWRRSGRRAKYGQGVSFSHSVDYALSNSSLNGALIVARVLVGTTGNGSWYMEIPQDGVDTTTSGGSNCNVYVKYSDHEFYPEYIVYL